MELRTLFCYCLISTHLRTSHGLGVYNQSWYCRLQLQLEFKEINWDHPVTGCCYAVGSPMSALVSCKLVTVHVGLAVSGGSVQTFTPAITATDRHSLSSLATSTESTLLKEFNECDDYVKW